MQGTTQTRRTYGDPCGIARALDHVGERWALLIVRDLILGPKRFTDLRASLPHVSPDILAARLRELEHSGIIRRDTQPPPSAARVYELTERGRELEPVVLALGRWGSQTALPDGNPPLGVDAFLIALQTLFDPRAAQDFHATVELRLDGQKFTAQLGDERVNFSRGGADRPDATITADVEALRETLWRGVPGSQMHVTGDARVAASFLNLFRRPA